jgi:aminodeoxyfutalosine deaminase
VSSHPKIELHVHFEGACSAELLFSCARANGVALPVRSPEELRSYLRFADFGEFLTAWRALRLSFCRPDDFRALVVDYARQAVGAGAVYVEGIFSPRDFVRRGVAWEALFEGFGAGAAEARAVLGVEVRLTPDISRGMDSADAEEIVRWSARYRDAGVVGVGLGGAEADAPTARYARAFALAHDLGLGVVPHAGETAGAAAVRAALTFAPARLRHGVRAVEDSGLVRELAARGVVCDVCLSSNIALGVVPSVDEHPLPRLIAAGVPCTVNTDGPLFFDCDLEGEHALAAELGADPAELYDAGVRGALCDDATRARLAAMAPPRALAA